VFQEGSGMADDQHYDVVIIGTGAGGGTLGHRLAMNGAKVLWLERGPFLPRERDNWQTEAVFVRGKYTAQETWYDRHGNEFQPDGLGNSSGVVGRHYMRHNNDALMAVSREPNPTLFQKTLAMNDWYLGADDWEFPLGGIQMLGKSDDEEIRAQAPRWAGKISPDLPFEVLAHHAVDIWLCGEDLPQADNRVTVDAEGAIHLSIDEKNNVEGVKRLRHKLDGMLSELGMHEHHLLDRSLYLHKSMPIGATAHQAGTVRFGTDPAASALDVNCKAHDVDNLYVVDTSFFPSIGAVNPSLTAIANALRVGDHITERLA
jgi:choline dehydrogenase-like flavoprotein